MDRRAFTAYTDAMAGEFQLYRFGVALFCKQVLEMERATGVAFVQALKCHA